VANTYFLVVGLCLANPNPNPNPNPPEPQPEPDPKPKPNPIPDPNLNPNPDPDPDPDPDQAGLCLVAALLLGVGLRGRSSIDSQDDNPLRLACAPQDSNP